MTNKKNKCERGYSLVELLLAVIVGAAVLAATYSSYLIVARQYQRISAFGEVQEVGIPAINIVARDIRMAGHRALDNDLIAPFGAITDPIIITDNGTACCDEVEIVYDLDTANRQRIRYHVEPRVGRDALYMDRDDWNGAAWIPSVTDSLVADYIEDFQLVGADLNSNGDPTLVDVSMRFRNRNVIPGAAITYNEPAYYDLDTVDNYTVTDNYYRDEFNITISIRNLREVVY